MPSQGRAVTATHRIGLGIGWIILSFGAGGCGGETADTGTGSLPELVDIGVHDADLPDVPVPIPDVASTPDVSDTGGTLDAAGDSNESDDLLADDATIAADSALPDVPSLADGSDGSGTLDAASDSIEPDDIPSDDIPSDDIPSDDTTTDNDVTPDAGPLGGSCEGQCGGADETTGCLCQPGCQAAGTCCTDFQQTCLYCGNGTCDTGETLTSCAVDCGPSWLCLAAQCPEAYTACWENYNCLVLHSCLVACEEPECSQSCVDDIGDPNAAILHSALVDCLVSTGCEVEPVPKTCDEVHGFAGCCANGNVYYMNNGERNGFYCAETGCGWNAALGGYDCGESGTDPSGVYPPACFGENPTPEACGSCEDRCFESNDSTADCWCQPGCYAAGTCCADFVETCPHCGNGTCDSDETLASCGFDCHPYWGCVESHCSEVYAACWQNYACLKFASCLNGCEGPECSDSCAAEVDDPNAATLWSALSECASPTGCDTDPFPSTCYQAHGYQGCCANGGLYYVASGELHGVFCDGNACGWNAEAGVYDCNQTGADPSGAYPLECFGINPSPDTCPCDCDDGDACTADACDPTTGECIVSQTPLVNCDDGDVCTADACDPATGECIVLNVPLINCDDEDPCSTDFCDPSTGECSFAPADGALCSDGNPCTVGDLCQGGVCSPGAQDKCYDANVCTADACDMQTGACLFAIAEPPTCAQYGIPADIPINNGEQVWTVDAGLGWSATDVLYFQNPTGFPRRTEVRGGFLFDATAVAGTHLTFAFFSHQALGGLSYQSRFVEFSTDGFQTIALSHALSATDPYETWQLVAVDISPLISTKFQVRFRIDQPGNYTVLKPDGTYVFKGIWVVDSIFAYGGPIITVNSTSPYIGAFDSQTSGWLFTPAVNQVGWAIDATPAVPGSFAGPSSLNFNNGVDFGGGVSVSGLATSPVIDLTGAAGYHVSAVFREWVDTQVDPSGQADQRWVSVLDQSGTMAKYPLTTTAGHIKGWRYESLDLNLYGGTLIRLQFGFDSNGNQNNTGAGWFVDDLTVQTRRLPMLSDGITCANALAWAGQYDPLGGPTWNVDSDGIPPYSADCSLNINNGTNYQCAAGATATKSNVLSQTFLTGASPTMHIAFRYRMNVEADPAFDLLRLSVVQAGASQTVQYSTPLDKAPALNQWAHFTTTLFTTTPTGGSGQVRLRFEFDSVDCQDNGGAGVFIDDVFVY